ncbi:SDR family NAD(P)-dependent oxidoreductase [Paenibacillus filicis]|uniref:SDR family NAD(P)-dependent oxidoreductase n=1 Tax=Paenibacillus gyeongsangnamensis TaxID=3388067 RepID=A0ABT4QJP1_9BACL|nr:SDR family NAD(P)-dependent oxidoreductase [Paenibacillus filicis]MCZ8517064.1 SDR family NAD(P)-dependent oxidoreductase [Paenibacillus filicis]
MILKRSGTTWENLDEELGANVHAIQAEAADPASMENAVSAAVATFGRLDIVFANAGIAAPTPLGSTELSVFEEVLKLT